MSTGVVSAELGDNLGGSGASGGIFLGREGDGANAGMPSSSVALANRCEIEQLSCGVLVHGLVPTATFGTEAGPAEAYAIDRLLVEEVGNELVVALELVVGDVKVDRASSNWARSRMRASDSLCCTSKGSRRSRTKGSAKICCRLIMVKSGMSRE